MPSLPTMYNLVPTSWQVMLPLLHLGPATTSGHHQVLPQHQAAMKSLLPAIQGVISTALSPSWSRVVCQTPVRPSRELEGGQLPVPTSPPKVTPRERCVTLELTLSRLRAWLQGNLPQRPNS